MTEGQESYVYGSEFTEAVITNPGGATRTLRLETERALLARGVVGGVQTTTGSVRRGETHWVYGRYKRPCRRCSTPITFRESAGTPWARETWWCPRCQPAPASG